MDGRAPACPRCGYDQSGVIDAWDPAGACPLEGVCSECGLAFAWADIFGERARVRGFFEHANTRRRCLGWAFTTLWWTVRPWEFWRRITLFTPVIKSRMVVWPLLVLALMHAMGSVVASADRAIELWGWPDAWDPLAFVDCWTSPVVYLRPAGWWGGPTAVVWDPGVLPLVLAFVVGTATWPFMLLLLGQTLRAGRIRGAHIIRATAYSLAGLAFLEVVRGVDAAGSLAQRSAAAFRGADPIPPDWFYVLRDWKNTVLNGAMVIWWPVWWWCAINHGFRLRHGTWVWALLLVASVLAALLAAQLPWLWAARQYAE